jgi:hypothetical protein
VSPEYVDTFADPAKSRPSVCGPTTAFIFFDRKENEAKETPFYFFRRILRYFQYWILCVAYQLRGGSSILLRVLKRLLCIGLVDRFIA